MNFADVLDISIPEGDVRRIVAGGAVIWERPYLDISPELIWLTPSALNDVLSNTDWTIN